VWVLAPDTIPAAARAVVIVCVRVARVCVDAPRVVIGVDAVRDFVPPAAFRVVCVVVLRAVRADVVAARDCTDVRVATGVVAVRDVTGCVVVRDCVVLFRDVTPVSRPPADATRTAASA